MTSPLRYPGGKTRATKLLWEFLQKEYPSRKTLLSPFMGGGSFELFCSKKGMTIIGNDAFKPVATFWDELIKNKTGLADAVELLRPLSKAEFYNLRRRVLDESSPEIQAAFFFAINRTSFSGSTFSGGYSQESADGRFTESSIERIRKLDVSNIKSVSNLDFVDFLEMYPPTPDTSLFLDPPYFIENYLYGRDGDMHKEFDHDALAGILQTRSDWILCYNDCPRIRELYKGCRTENVSWTYSMNKTKKSNEILILPALAGK
jgi:DNA adenine methylase